MMGFCLAFSLWEPAVLPNLTPINVKHAALNGETHEYGGGIGSAWRSHHLLCVWTENRPEKQGIHLETEGRGSEEWRSQSPREAEWHSQFKCQLSSSRDRVIDFPLTERSHCPTVVFKCLVYGGQNHGWIYWSKQLRFKWHFKTNSWHLNDSKANGFMNTKSLFINITWDHFFCGIYSLFWHPAFITKDRGDLAYVGRKRMS